MSESKAREILEKHLRKNNVIITKKYTGYLDKAMQEYAEWYHSQQSAEVGMFTKNDLINLVQSLKDYTHESHNILGHDEREAEDFVDIFLNDKNRTNQK